MNIDIFDDQLLLIAQLNERLQPADRFAYYEEPLDQGLRSRGIGEVSGGGTLFADESDGIEYCDIEIRVHQYAEETLKKIVQALERLDAPKGSLLRNNQNSDVLEFGSLEGMGIFLNGRDLPAEVYKNSDVNEVINSLEQHIGEHGKFRSYWEGSTETALYFYGQSFESMKQATVEFISKEPLCSLSRVVQIT